MVEIVDRHCANLTILPFFELLQSHNFAMILYEIMLIVKL